MRLRLFVLLLLLFLLGGLAGPVHAQANIQVVSDKATIAFPETIQFSAEFKSGTQIQSAILQYGVDQLTCGTVQAEAFPSVTPATDVSVSWTWEMRQSGSLPPGSTVWWQWLVTDSGGASFTSPQQTILWLDDVHSWQVITGGDINLHYYDESASFGQQLHDAAVSALGRLSKDIGITTTKPVDIYIYANTNDLKDAVLYAPSWVGGQAFPESNIVIIGVTPDQLDWGKSTEAHELTHVLVGHLTFSCLSFMPTWLNEGLAMYGEGGVQPAEQTQFDQAKANNQLPSLRSLIGGFSEEASRATLSYTEAYSVVDFMIKTYGQNKMLSLLEDLKNGQTMDDALQSVYGFNTDGLEAAWRASIGAPLQASSGQPTPVPTPTNVPTIVPIGAVPVAQAAVSTPHPTEILSTSTPAAVAQAPGGAATPVPAADQGGARTKTVLTILEIAGACLVAAVLLIGLPVFFALRRRRGRSS
jgi:hypothetical protein